MVITIASFKGGVGKSTTALHLDHILNEIAPTMLVDTDPNKTATLWSRRSTTRKFHIGNATSLARDARNFKHFVIDTPARPENLDLRGLLADTDLLIMPTPPNFFALDTLQDAHQVFQEVGSPAIRILLTQTPPSPQKDAQQAREILTELQFQIFKGQIRRAKAFEYAARQGCLVREVRGDSNGILAMADYESVAEEVLQTVDELAALARKEVNRVAVH